MKRVSLKEGSMIHKILGYVESRKLQTRKEITQWFEGFTVTGAVSQLLQREYIREDEEGVLHFVSWEGLPHRDMPVAAPRLEQIDCEVLIMNRLEQGEVTTKELRELCSSVSGATLDRYLANLARQGFIKSVRRGVWSKG